MKSKLIALLSFLIFIPVVFAAEIKPAPKTAPVVKKTPAKVVTAPLSKNIASPTKKQVSVLVSKNIKKTELKTEPKAVVHTVVKVEKPRMTSIPKENPEIPIRKVAPKAPCRLKNEPPAIKPNALQGTELRKIAKEASLELQDEETILLGDLRILWQYAVENSETIKFAIYKLSDPKGDLKKADESKIKKLLKPIAGITPFVAATAANPIAAGSSILGGTFMNDILSEDKYKQHLEKVTDADLVILAKAIEDLQNNLVTTYYEYNTSKKILEYSDKNLQNRKQLCDSLTNAPEETIVIADTFYREALARQNQAQANLLLKRAALEQLVGNDAILLIENKKKQPKQP